MKLTLDEWITLQKRKIKVCSGDEDVIPKQIFIGVLKEDGIIESEIRLVAVSEWKKFMESWERMTGEHYPSPQFFLFCE